MKIKQIILLSLVVTCVSCMSKSKESVEIQKQTTVEERQVAMDPLAKDSVKEALEKQYKQMRVDTNINYPYGSPILREEIFLDRISFKGKEEFYRKVELDIAKTLAYQKEYEEKRAVADNEKPNYDYKYGGYDYFDAFQYIFPIVEVYLQSKKFTFPTIATYEQRMKEVFGYDGKAKNNYPRVEDKGRLNCFLTNAGQSPPPYDADEVAFYGSDYLLLDCYFYTYLGYPFIYTSLGRWDKIPATMFGQEEIKDAKNWKACIRESIYHQNNYLFNKSPISRNWLYLHDQEFLIMLYNDFGYYGDDQLNQLYIEDVKSAFERFLTYDISPLDPTLQPSLFNNYQGLFGTYRAYDQQYLINKKVLEQFVELTNSEEDYLYPYILQYAVNRWSRTFEVKEDDYRELKMFLISHLCYYSQKIYEKNPNIAAVSPGLGHYSALYDLLFLKDYREQFLPYLKRHNYFGYADYPAMIEQMREEYGMW